MCSYLVTHGQSQKIAQAFKHQNGKGDCIHGRGDSMQDVKISSEFSNGVYSYLDRSHFKITWEVC